MSKEFPFSAPRGGDLLRLRSSLIWHYSAGRRLASGWLVAWAMLATALAQPVIVSVSPTNGATGVAGELPVVFSFNVPMDTNMSLAYFFSGAGLVLTDTSWSADGRRMTNTPSSAFPGNTAINWMVMGQSATGQMLGGTTSGSFTTGSGGPTLLSVTPQTGSTNVALAAPVIFTFNTNMAKTACRAMFYGALGSPVSVIGAWNAEGTQFTNTPNPPFTPNTSISWLIVGQDAWGRDLSGAVSGVFMTGNGGGTTPTLLSMMPTNTATGVQTNLPVIFVFSVAMDTNLTVAQFRDAANSSQLLPVTSSWAGNQTMLSCTPTPGFPAGKSILWSVQGQAATGEVFAGANGSFNTAGSSGPLTFTALLSRGEVFEQLDSDLFQLSGQEFRALSGKVAARSFAVATPSQHTNALSEVGTPDAVAFTDVETGTPAWATNYPSGSYPFLLNSAGNLSMASVSLNDSLLPAAPRLLNWEYPPRALLSQPLALQWNWDAGGATVNYVRVEIEQSGQVIFASPLPDTPGALNAVSNSVIVPAGVFTNTALAEVSLSAFSYTGWNTNSVAGLTLRAARHRTTKFDLRVADPATPPPALRSTNLAGFALGEPYRFMLRTTNGVRPIQFALAGGALPPGLTLEADGSLTGQATGAGTFDATVRMTDLVGQSTTQNLRVVTAQLPLFARPWLENASAAAGPKVQFELVGGAGADCVIEQSTNLANWTTHLTTNSPLNRLTLQVPLADQVMFFRARGLNQSLPHTPNPRTVVPVLNTNTTTSAELPWLGGTLSLTNTAGYVFTLNVPPGALRRPELITMTDVAQVQGLPLSGGLQAAVDLQPEGLTFRKPVRLDITAPAAPDPKTLIAFGALADGSQFALRPSFVTNRTASQFLRHFSSAGVGNGTAGEAQAQAQNFPPDDPNNSAEQDAASAIQNCRVDPNCDINSEETKAKLREIYVQMADQVILPALRAASSGTSDDALDQALYKWLDWARQITLLGLVSDMDGGTAAGNLPDRMRRATAMASDGVINGIDRACQECIHHDLARMSRVLRLAHVGELLGFGTLGLWKECAQKCLVYKLKIEAEITATTSSGTYRTKTRTEPKLTLANDSGEKYGESFTGSGRWFIEEFEPLESNCSMTPGLASGTARIPTVLVDLFKERTVTVPLLGSFVVYDYDPTLWVALGAELSGTPSENLTIQCPQEPPQTVDRVFGPAFLTFHADETGSDQTGSMVLWLRNFDQGSGETIFTKDYVREHATSKGPVQEKTHIELIHTPSQ